jgi:hypothetical protein
MTQQQGHFGILIAPNLGCNFSFIASAMDKTLNRGTASPLLATSPVASLLHVLLKP